MEQQNWTPLVKILSWLFLGVFVLVFPFIVLIRGAVFFHIQYAVSPWFSIMGGIFFSGLILYGYFLVIYLYFYGMNWKWQHLVVGLAIVTSFILGYTVPGLNDLPAKNAKFTTVKATFRNLHPVLRLGVSTILVLDPALIVTDAQRLPDDYKRMGLAPKHYSLHFEQSNGFVHAVDIRVNGRSAFRNFLIQTYFNIMGFNTLRHIGTADHLHVSLESHDRPGAL